MIHIKYVNDSLGIGLVIWREVYDITCAFPELLHTEIYEGNLVFRKKRKYTTHQLHEAEKRIDEATNYFISAAIAFLIIHHLFFNHLW